MQCKCKKWEMYSSNDIIKQLKEKGWDYNDHHLGSHIFKKEDPDSRGCHWSVVIEDNTDDEKINDWLIHVGYNDPDNKDWYGQDYEEHGCVERNEMKLFMMFIGAIEAEERKERK